MPAHPLHAIAASAAEALARPLVPAPRARGALGSRAPRERASVLHAAAAAIRSADPRHYQIAALSLLRGYGVVRLRFGIACLGSVVVNRAARSDVTFAFLAAWAAIVFGRSAWLGEPMSIPLHRLENGMLLQFAFFMISDPRTTPASRAGRILFAALVALGAGYVQFKLFRTNGLLWSLALGTLAVPLLDRLLPGARYEWNRDRS